MFYCYVLRSRKTERRYIGSCEDLNERIRRHNAGDSKATKHGMPWVLVHSEAFATRAQATRRERYYKTGRGREQLDTFTVERSPRRQVGGSNPLAPIFIQGSARGLRAATGGLANRSSCFVSNVLTPNSARAVFPPRTRLRFAGSRNQPLDRVRSARPRNISNRDAKNRGRLRWSRDALHMIPSV
jgi:putative endonuclease